MKKTLQFSFIVMAIIGLAFISPTFATDLTPRATATTSQNFLHTLIPQTNTGAIGAMIETIQYFDGLGRPCQTVAWQASPTQHDIVTPIAYDVFGREDKKYLPYAITGTSNGAFVSSDIYDQSSYYTGIYGSPDGPKAYSKTEFELSPLNRVLKQGAPGATWQPNSTASQDHSVKFDYGFNGVSDVKLWRVLNNTLSDEGYYDAKTLFKTTTWDENNNQSSGSSNKTREFKDKHGKVILKRTVIGSDSLSTYYVYDEFEQLRYVFPPKATSDGSITSTELSELCYQYKYDGLKRMIEKKLPGADWVYMVYDNRDRLVATQDGNMSNQGEGNEKWLVTKYDTLNRPVMTASVSLNDSRATLQAYFDGYSSGYCESRIETGVGYTLGSSFTSKFNLTETDLLTVTYYDTYDYPGVKSFDNTVNISCYSDAAGDSHYFDVVKGKVTGSRVKVLDGNENNSNFRWLITTNYYDDRYRPIETLRDLYSTTTTDNEVTSTHYDFTGKALAVKTKQVFLGNTNTVKDSMVYDHQGRIVKVLNKVNTGTEVTLASMEYDETGQLKQKSLHGTVGNGIQNLNYSYNIRGWLEKINDPDTNPSSTSTQKFNLGLYYNSVPSGLSVDAQYNGNISAMVWNTPEQSGALSPNVKQGYGYSYDCLNRLTSAVYGEGTNFGTNTNANNESLTYDLNGNIKSLSRYKKGIGQIDNLTYTYKSSDASNQLDRVDDSAGSAGFSENVQQSNEYGYDPNGNLTSDANKGYTSIQYNYLNLPKRIDGSSEHISYIYDAGGTKLAKVATAGTYTYYAGSFVYNGSSLNYILTREGMWLPGGNYQYYLKDHLGNTRLAVNTSGQGGTVVQQTDYYPFGMDIACYNGGLDNKYRYNGKEFQEDVINSKALSWYDYGARFYDPAIGRWHIPDDLGEIMYEESPFCYVGNNPILRIDPDGKIWDTVLDALFTLYDLGEAAYQYVNTGSVSATTKAALTADALAIVIPGVTGSGIVVRTAAHVADAAKTADKAVDVIKTADKVIEEEKVADHLIDSEKALNGNSKASTKAQHNYDIKNTETGDVVKTGTSGGKETKTGGSYRGNSQANKWNKQEGTPGKYKAEITNRVPEGKGARQKALKYEKNRANEVRNQLDPDKHKRP